jgi:uncharacterized protein (DUF433 family)
MTVATNSHIMIDDRGRPLIAGTRMKVIAIVMHHMKGLSADQIQEGYPNLSMSQIYSALAYYYDHKAELDAEIARQAGEFDRLRDAAIASAQQPSRAELERRWREKFPGRPVP